MISFWNYIKCYKNRNLDIFLSYMLQKYFKRCLKYVSNVIQSLDEMYNNVKVY